MKRLFGLCLVLGVGVVTLGWVARGAPVGAAGGEGGGVEKCAAKNGDVNADGKVDLSDAVTILGNLFLGSPTELVPLCAPPPAPSGLLDTGQKACYGYDQNEVRWVEVPCDQAACAGQDGSYATGCPSEGRFLDNGDGTVTDNCTGLQWQKDTADANGDGQTPDDGSDALPWCGALAYCENLSFAWHEDWRLPNVRELQSIVITAAQSVDRSGIRPESLISPLRQLCPRPRVGRHTLTTATARQRLRHLCAARANA